MPPVYTKVFSALNDTMTLSAHSGVGNYIIQVIGSGTLTLQYQDSLDGGSNYQPARVRDETAGTQSINVTAAGMYYLIDSSLPVRPRIICSAFTSGSFTVFARWVPTFQRIQFPIATATFSGGGQSLPLPASDSTEQAYIQLVGSGTLTVQLQDSFDGGVTYVPIRTFNVNTGTTSTDMTAAGLYAQVSILGMIRPRLFVSAFTSGTMAVFATVSGRSVI